MYQFPSFIFRLGVLENSRLGDEEIGKIGETLEDAEMWRFRSGGCSRAVGTKMTEVATVFIGDVPAEPGNDQRSSMNGSHKTVGGNHVPVKHGKTESLRDFSIDLNLT